jgi:glutaredoxin
MKTLVCIALVALFGYMSWNKIHFADKSGPQPLRDSLYVVVYGRDTCGITKRMRAALDRAGVPYEYKSVDNAGVGDELHPRMQAAGLDTGRYGLPVVDVNAEMFIRPKANIIADKYQQFARASEDQPANGVLADGMAAAGNLADPLVKCVFDGQETFMLQSQCPQ